jgi:cupin superfamily acireductone dioxygenase involved in methionine salvage
MPRKKSIKRSAELFITEANRISDFLNEAKKLAKSQYISWAYEYGVIRLYREFEALMLDVLVGVINNDTSTLSRSTGVTFPKHLTDEVCRYLIVGNGYFDFRGRDGLINTLKKYVPDDHFLLNIVKKEDYKGALKLLPAIRNYSAHKGLLAKRRALEAVGQKRMSDAGSWLKKSSGPKKGTRLEELIKQLIELAKEIYNHASY